MTRNTHIVIVDGYSTGAFYLPLLGEKGLRAVHVSSIIPTVDSLFNEIVAKTLEKWGGSYTAMLDGTQPLNDLVREVKKFAPKAVLIGCESGVELGDRLSNALELPGNNPGSSHVRRNKYHMHSALERAGIRALRGALVKSADELADRLRLPGHLPVVLKPPQSAGADGIHICRTLDEALASFAQLRATKTIFGDRPAEILVQEFAPGREVVVNTVSCRGRHRVSDLWRYSKMITPQGRSIYDGAELAADFGQETENILNYAFAVLDALEITFGPAHMEIMCTPQGPVLIECGARPMGASFPQELLQESVGHTQLELALESALHPEDFLARLEEPYVLRKHFFIKCLISSRKGTLSATPAVSLLTKLPSARSGNFLSCLQNDQIQCTVDLLSSPATLFLCHADKKVLDEDHKLLRDLENEAQNLLFELAPEGNDHPDPFWFRHIPDELWLKPEECGAEDAELIWKALDLKPGMEVLDCPCGDGRVGIHLARMGARITGVDLNPRFIDRAEARFTAENLQAVLQTGDMRDPGFDGCYDAVVNWFNSFGYFDVETDFEVLRNLARALKPGGVMLVEAPGRENVLANTVRKFDASGRELQQRWDELTERMYLPFPVEKDGRIVELMAGPRLYSLPQYRLLFRLAGLEAFLVRDENLEPYGPDSRRMLLVARKPKAKRTKPIS